MHDLKEIRFIETTADGDRELGRARLEPNGSVHLTGLPTFLSDDLRRNGVIDEKLRRLRLTDGVLFLRGCVDQFSGTYLRARVVR